MFTNILAFVYQLFWNSSQKVWCNNADDKQKSLYFLAHNSVLRFVHLSVCVEPKCLSISLRMHAHNLFDILIQEKYAWIYGGKTLQCEQRMEDYNGTTNEVNMHIHVINFTFFWSLIWTLDTCIQAAASNPSGMQQFPCRLHTKRGIPIHSIWCGCNTKLCHLIW